MRTSLLLLAALSSGACAADVTGGDPLVIDDPEGGGKADGIGNTDVRLTLGEPESLEVDDVYRGVAEVLSHSSGHVEIATTPLVVRDTTEKGLRIQVSDDHRATRFAFMVEVREAGTDDAWERFTFDGVQEVERSGVYRAEYFSAIETSTDADVPSGAIFWEVPPDNRCLSDGRSGFVGTWDSRFAPISGTDREYRITVLPIWNFCDWEDEAYEYTVRVQPRTLDTPGA